MTAARTQFAPGKKVPEACQRLVFRLQRKGDEVVAESLGRPAPAGWREALERPVPFEWMRPLVAVINGRLANHWAFGGTHREGGEALIQSGDGLPLFIGIYPCTDDEAILIARPRGREVIPDFEPAIGDEFARFDAEHGVYKFIIDVRTDRHIYVSPQVEAFIGVSREQIMADEAASIRYLLPADRPVSDSMRATVRQRGVASADLRFNVPGRGIRVIRHRISYAIDHIPPVIVGVCRDVTEMVAMTDQTRALLRGVEQSREGFLLTDSLGTVVYLNQGALSLFGLDQAVTCTGRHWHTLFNRASVDRVEGEALPALRADGRWTGELQPERPDGSSRDSSTALSLLPDGSMVWNLRDSTDEIRMQRQIDEGRRKFRSLVELLPVGLLVVETDGRCSYANQVALDFLGQGREGVFDRHVAEFCPGDVAGVIAAADAEVRRTRQSTRREFAVGVDESQRQYELLTFPIYALDGPVNRVCCILSDVTEARQLRERTVQLAEKRGELLEMQREFISMVSHEFRTPLTALQGTLYLIRKHCGRDPDAKVGRYLDLQANALATLKELVDQVLLLNRIEHTMRAARLEEQSLANVLRTVVAQFNETNGTARVQLRIETPENERLRLDQALMRAALDNLISNALKYSAPESLVDVSLTASADGWRVAVRDRGIGVPAGEVARLFDPFYRASNAATTAGTGLGLPIVKRAVELHGGRVAHAVPADGIGSLFWIDLPATLRGSDQPAVDPAAAPNAAPGL